MERNKLVQLESVLEFVNEACGILDKLAMREEDKELEMRFRSINNWLEGEKRRVENILEEEDDE